MAWAPVKAAVREGMLSALPRASETPRAVHSWAEGREGSRVMARICQDLSARKASATLPPCWPVMPVMTMSFIVSVIGGWVWVQG